MKNDYAPGRIIRGVPNGRLFLYAWVAFSSASLLVVALFVGYGLMISPFLVVGVALLVFVEKRRAKLDAPVRFPQRSRKTERRLARSRSIDRTRSVAAPG